MSWANKPKSFKVLQTPLQVLCARFSPDGKTLAAGCFDGSIVRWDSSTDSFSPMPPLKDHSGWAQAIAFHPTEKMLYSADSWGMLLARQYDQPSPKPAWKVDQAHQGWIRKIALSPDGQWLGTCGADKAARFFSTKDGSRKAEFTSLPWDPLSIIFAPDGKSFLIGDMSGKIQQRAFPTGEVLRDFDASAMYKLDRIQDVGGVRCMAFNPGGTKLVCGGTKPSSGGFVQGASLWLVFDWKTGKESFKSQGPNDNDGFVYDLVFLNEDVVAGVSSGQPGNGKFFIHKVGDAQPMHLSNLPNCHGVAAHPAGKRFAIVATNANSSGNGRVLDKEKNYPANHSPVHILEFS